MIKKCFFILLFFSFLNPVLLGQTTKFDSLIQSGIDQIYSLKYEAAGKTFERVKTDFPNHPAGKFFSAMITWWKIMIDLDNEEYDDLFYDQIDDVIEFCDDILDENENNVDAIFFKGGALGFRGRLASIREDWLEAAADGKDALPLVYDAYELEPDNKDVQLGFGIYNYYADVIPKQFPFIKPVMFFFPEGDKEKGLVQLNDAAYNGKYTRTEAKYFLMTLYYKFEQNYGKAQHYAEELNRSYPDNPIFERYLARIKRKQSYFANSVAIFESIYAKADSGKTGYTDESKREAAYYIGEDFYKKDEWNNAVKYFEECISLSKEVDEEESGFMISAMVYAAKTYDLMGKREKAVNYYEEILDLDEYRNSHEKAERHLENPFKK